MQNQIRFNQKSYVKCSLKDGPFCSPLEQYFTHSTAIYDTNLAPLKPKTYESIFKERDFKIATIVTQHKKDSHDEGRAEVGILVIEQTYSFLLKFFSYDKQIEDCGIDYTIEPGFTRVYTASTDITFRFPNQILLSQIRPDPEVRIDTLQQDDLDHQVEFPSDTFAYSVFKPFKIEYDRPV